ncbi:hypothetical protein GCM10023259_041130 [Thermocatellispora tengchongensis]
MAYYGNGGVQSVNEPDGNPAYPRTMGTAHPRRPNRRVCSGCSSSPSSGRAQPFPSRAAIPRIYASAPSSPTAPETAAISDGGRLSPLLTRRFRFTGSDLARAHLLGGA